MIQPGHKLTGWNKVVNHPQPISRKHHSSAVSTVGPPMLCTGRGGEQTPPHRMPPLCPQCERGYQEPTCCIVGRIKGEKPLCCPRLAICIDQCGRRYGSRAQRTHERGTGTSWEGPECMCVATGTCVLQNAGMHSGQVTVGYSGPLIHLGNYDLKSRRRRMPSWSSEFTD